MTEIKVPDRCPSCGLEGSLQRLGDEFMCYDQFCGQAFPINPQLLLKSEAKPKKKKTTTKGKRSAG